MIQKKETIGVVGAAGDLGRQLSRLLVAHGYYVLENDKKMKASTPVQDMLESCDIVHFCIPADAISLKKSGSALVVLHDSVMDSNEQASKHYFSSKAVPVHMLMNKEATVVVAKGYKGSRKASHHFSTLGQMPVLMSVKDHDRVIARSQAPLLLLIETLLSDLRVWKKKGILTPSAVDLLESLESRQANWTPATRKSILRNKQIDQFIDDLRKVKRRK